jgi:hypothetical protein
MSNVIPLIDPYRARLAELRKWFTSQANEPQGHLAAVTIAITGSGSIVTSGCAIEPEHARQILGRLDLLRVRLQAIAEKDIPVRAEDRGAKVIPLHRQRSIR